MARWPHQTQGAQEKARGASGSRNLLQVRLGLERILVQPKKTRTAA